MSGVNCGVLMNKPLPALMKILLVALLLLIMEVLPARAGFVTVRAGGYAVIADSPATRAVLPGRDRRKVPPPLKQLRGCAVMCFAGGALSMAGTIALLVLWPLGAVAAVALIVGTLGMGVAAILLGYRDARNPKPHPGLSILGFLLAFLALLPVLFPLSILVVIYATISGAVQMRRRRRQASRVAGDATGH